MYKILLAILMFLEAPPKASQHYINPTGTYVLVSKAKVVKGETYGYTGDIQIKVLSKNKIIVVLGVNMGAPAYNSGELFDTLKYANNICVYNGDRDDPTCRIILKFSERGINVTQKQADLNSACGFGHGVFANGFYEKKSWKVPVLRHPQTGELIK
ncbi:MAG: hypothetical protein M3N14_07335 [Bacteroidota bacterium]|nr:hypothetical protein [Bacteroidota bacterium]